MNFFRSSGSTLLLTCSAETTVPWMTSTSRPASSATWKYSSTRCGVSEAAASTPPSLISLTRLATSSALMGSL